MAIRPQGPEELDIRASSDLSMESSRRRSGQPTSSVATALDVRDGKVLYRAVTLDRTRDALGLGAGIWVGVWLVELIVLTANGGIADIAVCRDSGSESESRGKVLHFEKFGREYGPA